MTKILKINPVNPEVDMISEAAAVIKSGGVVVFPTETVYGIGADAFNGNACSKIFKAKNRPADNPLIVHISSLKQLDGVARDITDDFLDKAKILWPGPVTFILKKNARIPDEVSAGLDTVAVRMPASTIALRLIDESKVPIAAPSANISQKPSSTNAKHVVADLDGKVDMIIDGGDTAFGLESTVINMTTDPPMLLRPGAFTMEELEKFLGKITVPKNLNMMIHEAGIPISPGTKYRHYSPDKKVIAVKGKELLIESSIIASKDKKIAVICSNEVAEKISNNIKVIRLGTEADLYSISKNIFDAFRKVDKMEVDFALVQTFPERGIGLALMNRIVKASGTEPISSVDELKKRLPN
jgi:L-threonylcarbamoyladenylate synthase